MELQMMKNTISEMKNPPDGFQSRLDTAGGKIGKLGDIEYKSKYRKVYLK